MTNFQRAIVIVIDGVGIGAAPDAQGVDIGSNTLANTARAVGGLSMPNMARLGLGNIHPIDGVAPNPDAPAAWGKMTEISPGKDTTTGHWEMMGCPLDFAFPIYPEGFPEAIMGPFRERTGRGVVGNVPASGTDILNQWGPHHQETGDLIVYTSGDSVFQIAAHVDVVPVEQLWEYCKVARELLTGKHAVGRVIARPFEGQPGNYKRIGYMRRDFSILPPQPTFLERMVEAGHQVYGIGKTEDIFAHQGISRAVHTKDNRHGMDETILAVKEAPETVIFTNLVEFDSVYGHRNDPAGMARALKEFDEDLGRLLPFMRSGDILAITADHGIDPTTASTDHSREYVPLILYTPNGALRGDMGTRRSFCDLAATLEDAFGLPRGNHPGESMLQAVMS